MLALVKSGDNRSIEVNAAQEIGSGDAGFQWRAIRKTGHAHYAGGRLYRHIHCETVAVRPRQTVSGARGIDEPGIDLVKHGKGNAKRIHYARRKILKQNVAPLHQFFQQLATTLGLEVERDAT